MLRFLRYKLYIIYINKTKVLSLHKNILYETAFLYNESNITDSKNQKMEILISVKVSILIFISNSIKICFHIEKMKMICEN